MPRIMTAKDRRLTDTAVDPAISVVDDAAAETPDPARGRRSG